MSIRARIALIVACLSGPCIAVCYVVEQRIILERFLALERAKALDDSDRCSEAIAREIEHLGILCSDWGYWDDTYQYIQDQNEAYAKSNLTPTMYINSKFNAIWYLDTEGRVVFSGAADTKNSEPLDFPEFPTSSFPLDHPLLAQKAPRDMVSGILRTARGPLLLASRFILPTDTEAAPARGWLIFGRLLDANQLESLRTQTRVDFQIWDIDDPKLTELHPHRAIPANPGEALIEELSRDLLIVHSVINGIDQKPAILIQANVPRDISREGRQATQMATTSLAAAAGGTVLMLLVLLSITVERPLRRLARFAEHVGRTSDLTRKSGIRRSDEIGKLAAVFDTMIANLRESRARLSDSARRAGMADVARGILHNVGNVLNNVTVSTNTITDTVRRSPVTSLCRATELIGEHGGDLAQFISQDERGRALPEFLKQVSAALHAERGVVLKELDQLRESLGHLLDVIQQQGVLTVAARHEEATTLSALIDGAVELMGANLRQQSVRVERAIDRDLTLLIDRTKVLQILVNLLTNAAEAMSECAPAARLVRIESRIEKLRVSISIGDSGVGIAPESLTQIFSSGFSTKPGSRGVGLHFCAIAAGELGGELRAASAGPGCGATFVLAFPLRQPMPHPENARTRAGSTDARPT
ncbi:MAG: CHASE4 domain-containing protein [Phycisphaerae bacterium]